MLYDLTLALGLLLLSVGLVLTHPHGRVAALVCSAVCSLIAVLAAVGVA